VALILFGSGLQFGIGFHVLSRGAALFLNHVALGHSGCLDGGVDATTGQPFGNFGNTAVEYENRVLETSLGAKIYPVPERGRHTAHLHQRAALLVTGNPRVRERVKVARKKVPDQRRLAERPT